MFLSSKSLDTLTILNISMTSNVQSVVGIPILDDKMSKSGTFVVREQRNTVLMVTPTSYTLVLKVSTIFLICSY